MDKNKIKDLATIGFVGVNVMTKLHSNQSENTQQIKSKEGIVGKTITSAVFRKYKEDCDDIPYLDLTFSDGSSVTIEGTYGGYTGKSYDEYITFIKVGDESSLD